MVPEDGLEPSLPKETDFESVVYTNFTTRADAGHYTYHDWRRKHLFETYYVFLSAWFIFDQQALMAVSH